MTKISAYGEDTSPTTDDFIVTVDTGSGTTKKVKILNLGQLFATLAGAQTLQDKRITKRVTTIASSGSPTPNSDTSDVFTVTALAANATFGAPSGTPTDGQSLIIRIKDDGNIRTLSYNAVYRAIGVTLPTATVAGKVIYLGMLYNFQDSVWDVIGVGRQ